MSAEVGPIWRSIRRHRAFSLLVLEVTTGFIIVANLIITIRWSLSIGLPPSGHREADVVEVVLRRPAGAPNAARGATADLGAARALAAIPGVRRVAAVSATQIDDRWAMPVVVWSVDTAGAGPSACPSVDRSDAGVVAGWAVEADASLAETIDLRFVEGASPGAPTAFGAAESVTITRCLRDTLFGGGNAFGKVLRSNRHPPARITGVVEDVRMREPLLYQTQVTAIFPLPAADERVGRFLVRADPGRAGEVRRAAAALGGGDPDQIVTARLFTLAGTLCSLIARGTAMLLGLVAASLGVVAILGNLAVAAFFVGDRRRVIGLRRALGATRWDILRYLLLENLLATQIGNALGLACTLLLLPGAQRRFAGLHLAFADVVGSALLLSLAGFIATLVPAWRATRISPSEVCRGV
jgi:putative ABC transport system permease protein